MILGTEANLTKETRDSHSQFSTSPLGTRGMTMLIWRLNKKKLKKKNDSNVPTEVRVKTKW